MSRYQRHNPDEPVRHDWTPPGTPAPQPWRDFGCANGWIQNPPAYDECMAAKHVVRGKTVGRCLTRYSCDICRISFEFDSSD